MTSRAYTDYAVSTLASGINATDTACILASGTGALFPAAGAGVQFTATLIDSLTGTSLEQVLVTARSGNNITTMVRGQNGTTAKSYSAGDKFDLLFVSGDANKIAFIDQTNTFAVPQLVAPATTGNHAINASQILNNPTYADDTGAVNAYVLTLPIPVAALADGQRFSFSTTNANTNTTPTLVVSGLPAHTIVNKDHSALAVSQITANTIWTVSYNSAGAYFELENATTPTTIPTGAAKAWVNFTGAVAINKAFNVSSITHVAAGVFTVNLTTPMADTNYVVGISFTDPAANNTLMYENSGTFTRTTSSFQILCYNIVTGTITAADPTSVMVTVFD